MEWKHSQVFPFHPLHSFFQFFFGFLPYFFLLYHPISLLVSSINFFRSIPIFFNKFVPISVSLLFHLQFLRQIPSQQHLSFHSLLNSIPVLSLVSSQNLSHFIPVSSINSFLVPSYSIRSFFQNLLLNFFHKFVPSSTPVQSLSF